MDTVISSGKAAPIFQLSDLTGKVYSLEYLKGWIIVLNFWSAECVWSERVDRELMGYQEAWQGQVKTLWIASNANESPELIEKTAVERSLPVVLIDPQQQVADIYGVQTTPQFFVVDKNGILAYQGGWDDITFRQRVATQLYVPQVVEALRQGRSPQVTQTPPHGCALVRYSV